MQYVNKNSSLRRIKIQHRFIEQGRYKYRRAELRLCGKWLEDYGFIHGKLTTIRCERNKLIITIDSTEPEF